MRATRWSWRPWRRAHLGTDADRATFRTLHTAALASPALRAGLTRESAERAVRHLRALLGSSAVALTDTGGLLAWDGAGQHHAERVPALVQATLERTGSRAFGREDLHCVEAGCPARTAVVSPLFVEDRVVGTLQAFAPVSTAGLARATEEVAQWVSGQLELAELDSSRTRLMEAEVRALRAQISPHFVYNSLGAIASFVRTDPDRARELLLEFADFTRYSFRRHGEFTTLAEELKSVERYLLLEQARFGERLQVTLSIAPEVLPVAVPFLCIQPLVENAVRHGLEGAEGGRRAARAGDRRGRRAHPHHRPRPGPRVPHRGRGRRARRGPRPRAPGPGRRPQRRLGRPRQRRRAAAHGVRRRVRSRRRDRSRGRHEGRGPGAQVRPGGARLMNALRVLVVDDEKPTVDELTWLLQRDPRIGEVLSCTAATEALRTLQETEVDAIFLDISMPGLSGLELAQILSRFKQPPRIVFVTAHEQHAVEAFDLQAVDYVLKPVRAERLAEAVRRVGGGSEAPAVTKEVQIPVELGGVTRFINRSDITHVEAQGDYARLHTPTGSHLVRTPLSTLEEEWRPAGFLRIHRSLLVALAHVHEVRMDAGRCSVVVSGPGGPGGGPGVELGVSRRHTRQLRDLLLRRGQS